MTSAVLIALLLSIYKPDHPYLSSYYLVFIDFYKMSIYSITFKVGPIRFHPTSHDYMGQRHDKAKLFK